MVVLTMRKIQVQVMAVARMELRWFRECGSHRGTHLTNKEAKRPAYGRSLLALRSINDAQEQRAFDPSQPLRQTSDDALKGQPTLTRSKNDEFGNATNSN